jgi:hypothetical protein
MPSSSIDSRARLKRHRSAEFRNFLDAIEKRVPEELAWSRPFYSTCGTLSGEVVTNIFTKRTKSRMDRTNTAGRTTRACR